MLSSVPNSRSLKRRFRILRSRLERRSLLVVVLVSIVFWTWKLSSHNNRINSNPDDFGWWCPSELVIPNPPFKMALDLPEPQDEHPFWTKERSRNLIDYLHYPYVSMDTGDCWARTVNEKIKILVILQSKIDNFQARTDNRKTWMKLLATYGFIKVLNVVGVGPTNETVEAKLEEEQREHCDILQVNVIESSWNLTLKTAFAIQYIYRKPSWPFDDGPPDFIMKGDDDAFYNLNVLQTILKRPFFER